MYYNDLMTDTFKCNLNARLSYLYDVPYILLGFCQFEKLNYCNYISMSTNLIIERYKINTSTYYYIVFNNILWIKFEFNHIHNA